MTLRLFQSLQNLTYKVHTWKDNCDSKENLQVTWNAWRYFLLIWILRYDKVTCIHSFFYISPKNWSQWHLCNFSANYFLCLHHRIWMVTSQQYPCPSNIRVKNIMSLMHILCSNTTSISCKVCEHDILTLKSGPKSCWVDRNHLKPQISMQTAVKMLVYSQCISTWVAFNICNSFPLALELEKSCSSCRLLTWWRISTWHIL